MKEYEYIIRDLLRFIGEDPDREGLVETPHRILKAWKEKCCGYNVDIPSIFKVFEDGAEKCNEMVIVDNIPVISNCVPGTEHVTSVTRGSTFVSTIQEGEKIFTLNEAGVPVETTVEKISTHKAQYMTTIVLENGKSITVTKDHPIKLKDRWEEAGNLTIEDRIEYINPATLHKQQFEFNYNHPDFGYLIGALLSDGHIDNKMHVKLQVKSLEFANKFKRAIKNVFNADAKIYVNDKKWGEFNVGYFTNYTCIISSSQIAKRLLKIIGFDMQYDGPKTKTFKVPKIIYSRMELFKPFLEGYFDGDGSQYIYPNGNKLIKFATSNKQFAYELCSIFQNNPYISEGLTGLPVYIINVPTKSWEDRYYNWRLKHGFEQTDLSLDIGESDFVKIKSITTEYKPTKVYSFKCKEYPTFLVKGVLTHNCEHHGESIIGVAHIGYIPNGKIVGLSKFVRLVDAFARRLQVQERLTNQIADAIIDNLDPLGCAVIIKATHNCMNVRGVKTHGVNTTTSAMRGVFMEKGNDARLEFLSLINSK